jgi:streptogramin lyase
MFVRDTNGRVFKRISGPHTVEGQQPAAFDISFTTPLLQPAVIETPYPANGTANFVQNDALGNTFNSASYSGCDPLTDVTVYTTGNDSCFLKKISVEDNSEDNPLSSPLRELSANMSNRQENFEFLMPYIPVKIKVEWYSNFSMLAAERAAQTSTNSISYLRYATLKDAIDAAQTGETTYVLNNLTANGSASGGFSSSTSTISISKSVTLSVKKDVSAVIKRAASFTSAAFFTVDNTSGILKLEGNGTGQLILDGGAVWANGTGSPPSPANGATNSGVTASCPLVKISSGSLAIGSGAVLRNNSATYPTLEISGGSTLMTGGSIEYNKNTNESNTAGGGGVEVSNGSFTMSEGVIKHNWARTGGGVHIPKNVPNNPQFVMKGTAVIEYNKAEGYGGGGIKTDKPISISEDAVVRYNEAKHTGNPGSDEEGNGEGGGVYVHEQKLNMTGNAKIHGNRASRNGAGVCARADLHYAVLSLSGSAVIDADNDVYLKNNDTIAIDGNLGGAFPVATVTPSDYVSGRQVLTGSYLAANYDKFAVTPPQLGYWCGIKNDGKLSMPWVSTIAGGGSDPSILDGQGTTVQLSEPWGIAVDNSGNVYFADSGHHRIGKIDLSTNTVSTFAGTGTEGSTDGSLTSAKFNQPHGIAFNNNRTVLYVADRFNHLIRKIDLSTNMVSTFAGTAGDTSIMHDPWGVAVDSSGNVYVADTLNHRILKITSTGSVSTLAGTGTEGYFDGSGSSAQFNAPNDVAVDSVGNVYVADTGNGYARKITSGGNVSTLAGPPEGYFLPRGIVVDASGNIYVSEASAACIRKITDNGVVTIFAGIRSDGGYVDGAAVSAKFNLPTKMAIDSAGDIYVSDTYNHRIRKITQ